MLILADLEGRLGRRYVDNIHTSFFLARSNSFGLLVFLPVAVIVSSSDQYMAFKQLTLEKTSHKVSRLSS